MNKIAFVASAAFILLMGVGMTRAQEAQPIRNVAVGQKTVKKQTVCPVMGGAVNTNLFVEYEGKRIYVCYKGCIETVKKDSARYIRQLEAGGIKLEKAQITCPVMGGKIDKKVYADYNGKRVYFCCPGCIPQFKKDPDKYLKKLEAEGIVPEPIPSGVDTEKKETPKNTGTQAAPKAEHKHSGGGFM